MTNWNFQGILLLSVASLLLTILGADARIIKLDLKSDENSEFWSKISCTYKENYLAYNTSCIKNVVDRPTESEFKDKNGLWSPCGQGLCEFIYYGNSFPQPKSIKVSGLVKGKGEIKVQGKQSAIGEKWDVDIGDFSKLPKDKFGVVDGTTTIGKAYAFRIQLKATTGDSVAVVDYIELDLGDSVPEPIPDPTTEAPGPPQTDYILETKADAATDWAEISCNYADLAEDLWVWGCSADLDAENDALLGFWSPCVSSSCNFVFNAYQDFNHPQSVTLKGNLGKGGKVTFSHKSTKLGSKTVQIASFDLDQDTTEFTYEIPYYYEDQLYNVTVTSVDGSVMLIDSVSVHLSTDLVGETTVTEPTTEPPAPPKVTDPPKSVEETTAAAHTMSSYVALIVVATLSLLAL